MSRKKSSIERHMFYMEMGQRIKLSREMKKITQAMVAKKLGYTRTSVINMEAGRQAFDVYLLVRISKVIGVKMTTLLPRIFT